jgi:hypothetical protein
MVEFDGTAFSTPVQLFDGAPLMSLGVGPTYVFAAAKKVPSTLKFANLEGTVVDRGSKEAMTFPNACFKVNVASGNDGCLALAKDKVGVKLIHVLKSDPKVVVGLARGRVGKFNKDTAKATAMAANGTHLFVLFQQGGETKIAFTDDANKPNWSDLVLEHDLDFFEASYDYVFGATAEGKTILVMRVHGKTLDMVKKSKLPEKVVKIESMAASGSYGHVFATLEINGKLPVATKKKAPAANDDGD